MHVTLVQCESALVADGTLSVLGGGWSVRQANSGPFAVAGVLWLDWSDVGQDVVVTLTLLDEDGQTVAYEAGEGEEAELTTSIVVRGVRPDHVKPGSDIPAPFTVTFPPMTFEPNKRFRWSLSRDGQILEDWTPSFQTLPDCC